MKFILRLILTVIVFTFINGFILNAQYKSPSFTIEKIKLKFPAFLPGIMDDSTVATYLNDTISYNLNGYLFKDKGYLVPVANYDENIKSTTPWETITEMTNAFLKKDTKTISNLYATTSKEKIDNLLNGSQKDAFLDYVSKAKNVTILGGIEYQKGFMVFTKDDTYGVHQNYLIKVGNQYKLEALDDKAATAWNIALFYKFNPKPMVTDIHVSLPDSIKLDDTVKVTCTVPKDYWVSVYLNQPYGPTAMLIQDNGQNDLDPTPGKVSFMLKGISFVDTGMKNVYLASFNFPVQRVSPSTLVKSALHHIKVK